MSLGYGAWCKITEETDEHVMFLYGNYNLNDPQYRNEERVMDGTILVAKKYIDECAKKLSSLKGLNGKQLRRTDNVAVGDYIAKEMILVSNCSNCWSMTESGVDRMILRLLYKMVRLYAEQETLPDFINLHC